MRTLLQFIFLLLGLSAISMAQLVDTLDPRKMADDIDAIKAQMKQIKQPMFDHPEVKALLDTRLQLQNEFNIFKNRFGPVTNAYKAMYQAKDDLWATVEAESAKDPAIQALKAKSELSEGRKRDLTYQLDLALFELNHSDSSINQILDRDRNLAALAKGQEPPDVESEAQKKWMMQTSYELVRNAVRAQMPEYQAIKEQLISASNQLLQAHNDFVESKTAISITQQAMYRGQNEICTQAQAKLNEAINQVRLAYQLPEVKAFDEKLANTGKTIDAKMDELANLDPRMESLQERLSDLEKRRRQVILDIQKQNQLQRP